MDYAVLETVLSGRYCFVVVLRSTVYVVCATRNSAVFISSWYEFFRRHQAYGGC